MKPFAVIDDHGELHEECGIMAIYGDADAAARTHAGLVALQHRGQESAGIAGVGADGAMHHHRGMGLVGDALSADAMLRLAPARSAIGHVRYSTAGGSDLANAQPLVFNLRGRGLALAHNGNLTNAADLRRRLEVDGAIFQTTSDTEVIAHLIARAGRADVTDAVREALATVEGGCSICVLCDDRLIVARDRHGLRPLALGVTPGGAWCAASESCAFDAIGATFMRDVNPGELVAIDRSGLTTHSVAGSAKPALCTFEHIYFARPDSDIDGHNVHTVRKRFGRLLAERAPVDADVVTGVPDSSISSAIGYAEQARIPYEIGLVKNRYVGRTFIAPSQEQRTSGVRMKLNAVRSVVGGARVVMVDDSLVRGTTSGRIVRLLREAGAREVHVRIASPPVRFPCFYGIDTSARDELIAATASVDEICQRIGADSLAFLDEPTMMEAFGVPHGASHGHCNACFTGRYPTQVPAHATANVSEGRLACV